MSKLETMVRRNLITILLLLLLGGFAMLLAELLITNHVDGIQNVANVASLVGAVAILLGFFAKGTFRHLLVLLLLVLSLSGLLGAWEHLQSREGHDEARVPAALSTRSETFQTISNRIGTDTQGTTQQEAGEQQQNMPSEGSRPRLPGGGAPPLAPLSLSGLSLMGAVLLLAKRDGSEAASA